MKTHWDKFINIKQLLFESKPSHVLELGALDGENTENLMKTQKELGFKLTVISDDLPNDSPIGVTYLKGVSYKIIEQLEDNSIDFVLLDTDHNHWTFQMEMIELHKKLKPESLILIHDVDTFYYDTGVADGYGDGSEYPEELITSTTLKAGSLGTSVIDFLATNRFGYRLIRWIPEGNGCALIKKSQTQFYMNILKAEKGRGKRKCFA